jgi:hypothetical protein
MQRDVNDRDFDVALHVVFRNRAAHDKYQTHPRHLKFIEEAKALWKKVRVFDSYVSMAAKDRPRAKRIPLPDPASRFAGMIRARVISRMKGNLVVHVEGIAREWRHSKAESSKALVGKKVLVDARKVEGEPVKSIARYMERLKVGEVVVLDVAHQRGEALTLLELSAEQRERAGAK